MSQVSGNFMWLYSQCKKIGVKPHGKTVYFLETVLSLCLRMRKQIYTNA